MYVWTEIKEKLDKLENTPGSNDKVELLREFLKDPRFKTVVGLALHQTTHFGVKTIPVFPSHKEDIFSGPEIKPEFHDVIEALFIFSEARGVSDTMKDTLGTMLKDNQEAYDIAYRIVNKDLRCGCNAGLVNKAVPGLIKRMPYMRCSTTGSMEFPAIVEEKADGMFIYAFDSNDKIEYRTRKGYLFHLNKPELDEEILRGNLETVYSGEMRILRDGKFLSRKKGNGILNRILKGSTDPRDHADVAYVIWDAVPIEDFWNRKYEVPYKERRGNGLLGELTDGNYILSSPKCKGVNSFEEAREFAERMIEEGGEGAILKSLDGIWKDHTSPNQIKFKSEKECELVITGVNPGKPGTKYEDCMGSIACESSCGGLAVNVGTGFSDELRNLDWEIGSIVTVRFNEVITKKGSKTSSLFLPRYIETRNDKDEADDLKYINGLKGL